MLVENRPFLKDVRVLAEAKALSAAGYVVSVIGPAEPKESLRVNIDGINIFRYPGPKIAGSFMGYLWEYGYSLVAMFVLSFVVLIRPGFDIIHAANPPDTAVFIALFYKMFGKRFVFDHHDLAPELYRVRFNYKSNDFVYNALLIMEKISCRIADHVIATNQSYKELEMQRDRVSETSITVVRNGPDPNWLKSVEPDPDLLGKSELIIGYAGTMGVQDGVDHLLKALSCLIEQGRTNFFCILVGDGDTLPKLKSMTSQMGLTNNILFTGWVNHTKVAGYLSAADICVAPEPSNTYNDASTMIKIMEYMALGKPIVAFNLPEHRVTAQNAALYASPNDVQDLAQRIAKLMDNPELRRTLGEIGRKRVENDLVWSHQKHCLLEAYEKLKAKA